MQTINNYLKRKQNDSQNRPLGVQTDTQPDIQIDRQTIGYVGNIIIGRFSLVRITSNSV